MGTMKTHWFPLIRPKIRAGYFLGINVALGGGTLGSHGKTQVHMLPQLRIDQWLLELGTGSGIFFGVNNGPAI